MEDIFEEDFGDAADSVILSDEGDAENDQNNDEEKENEKKEIKPKKIVRNPRYVLNAELLKGPKGLNALESHFKNKKFKGNHHEEEDLRNILKTYEYWCHRLYPKFPFKECIAKIETLGNKGPIQTHLKKVRSGLIDPDVEPDKENDNLPEFNSDDELEPQTRSENVMDDIPIELTEEQLETIRKNREKAELVRKERLKKIQEKAAMSLPDNGFESSENGNKVSMNVENNSSDSDVEVNENRSDKNGSESDGDEYVFKSVKKNAKKYFDESEGSDSDEINNEEINNSSLEKENNDGLESSTTSNEKITGKEISESTIGISERSSNNEPQIEENIMETEEIATYF